MTSISLQDSALATNQIARRSAVSWLNIWQVTTSVGLRYWANAAARGATPLDLAADGLRWLELVTARRAPDWSTPNELVESSGIMALRDFSVAGAGEGRADADRASSGGAPLVRRRLQPEPEPGADGARGRAHAALYVLEWLGATPETKNASIVDYLESVRSAIARIGEPVNLIGDCQGGWLATIYCALYPEDVATLTIGGAPIDFHAGDAAIADFVRSAGGMAPYRLAVELGGGMLAGDFMLGGFIGLQPETEISKQLELALHLDDDEYVERYREFQDWYAFTQPIPGAMYLWAVEHLFIGNELVRGTLEIDGRPVQLGAIRCPVNLLGGDEDHITPPEQVFALADHVGTPPADVTTRLTSGGHLGLFMGRNALRTAWRPMFEEIAARKPARKPSPQRRPALSVCPPEGQNDVDGCRPHRPGRPRHRRGPRHRARDQRATRGRRRDGRRGLLATVGGVGAASSQTNARLGGNDPPGQHRPPRGLRAGRRPRCSTSTAAWTCSSTTPASRWIAPCGR